MIWQIEIVTVYLKNYVNRLDQVSYVFMNILRNKIVYVAPNKIKWDHNF